MEMEMEMENKNKYIKNSYTNNHLITIKVINH